MPPTTPIASDHGAGGTLGFNATTKVLTWSGTAPASPAQVTVTFTVTVATTVTATTALSSTLTSSSSVTTNCLGTGDPRCVTSVGVSKLGISASTDVGTVAPGGTVTYNFTLTNTGSVPYQGITVPSDGTDVFDAAVPNGDQVVSCTVTGSGACPSGPGTTEITATGASWAGDIPVNGVVAISATATVKNPVPGGDTVLAGSTYTTAPGSNCPTVGLPAPCGTSVTILTPTLAITKSADMTSAVPGQQVHYTITVHNTGGTDYTSATVTDSLAEMTDDASYDTGSALALAGGVPAGTVSFDPDTHILTWTGALAAAAPTVTITYSVTVKNPDTGDKLLINTVTSPDTGATCPPGTTDPACRITVGVLTPALTISKTADTTSATPGATVTYTITVHNTGQTLYTGAAITDDLSGATDDATYNGDAAAVSTGASAGTVSYAIPPNLTWTGDLAIGDLVTITYTVTVKPAGSGDGTLANTVTSTTPGSNCAAGSTDPACSATVTVSALTIVDTASVATITPGGVIVYTVTVHNSGQTPIPDAAFTAYFAGVALDTTYNGDLAVSAGSITLDIMTASATWTGDLAPDATATVTGSFTVKPGTGHTVLSEHVDSTTPGSDCPVGGSDTRCSAEVTVQTQTLTINKSADVSTTTPGSAVQYTITVDNTGEAAYTGITVTDDLTGVLTDATYDSGSAAAVASDSGDAGTVSFTTPNLIWTGNLASGVTVTITYTVTVSNPDTGDRHLTNNVVSTAVGSNCPEASADTRCHTDVADLIPALTITKTADTTSTSPGATVGYTITVTNTGQTPYTGATVTDDLTAVIDEAAYQNDATATPAGGASITPPGYNTTSHVLSWTGDLPTGAAVTITYTVIVDDPIPGDADLLLTNAAISDDPGSTCPAGTTNPACSVTVGIVRGVLTISVPSGPVSLGATDPGGTTSADLGTVEVVDERDLPGLNWTATVTATDFTTGAGGPAETIPAADATYFINTLDTTTGTATFTPTPVTVLSTDPRTVVTATNATGDTGATWNPAIQIAAPPEAVAGAYTATITHSVS